MPIEYDVAVAEEAPQPEVRKIIRSGWGAVDTLKQEDANYAVRLKTGNDPVLIKFLQAALCVMRVTAPVPCSPSTCSF